MKAYLDKIFNAVTIDQVCAELQNALDSLRSKNYLDELPDYYEDISARSPTEVQDWFDEMKDYPQADQEGHLKEIFDLFSAALSTLRRLGFHR